MLIIYASFGRCNFFSGTKLKSCTAESPAAIKGKNWTPLQWSQTTCTTPKRRRRQQCKRHFSGTKTARYSSRVRPARDAACTYWASRVHSPQFLSPCFPLINFIANQNYNVFAVYIDLDNVGSCTHYYNVQLIVVDKMCISRFRSGRERLELVIQYLVFISPLMSAVLSIVPLSPSSKLYQFCSFP